MGTHAKGQPHNFRGLRKCSYCRLIRSLIQHTMGTCKRGTILSSIRKDGRRSARSNQGSAGGRGPRSIQENAPLVHNDHGARPLRPILATTKPSNQQMRRGCIAQPRCMDEGKTRAKGIGPNNGGYAREIPNGSYKENRPNTIQASRPFG